MIQGAANVAAHGKERYLLSIALFLISCQGEKKSAEFAGNNEKTILKRSCNLAEKSNFFGRNVDKTGGGKYNIKCKHRAHSGKFLRCGRGCAENTKRRRNLCRM
ncbi:MAG: hypothetical protein DBX39_03785 [Bacillota bacterium]|nr:MAG: hypothetical protein DBX39_03785 [Bacillota bacterium]